MKIRCYQQKYLFIYVTFDTNFMLITKHKSRTETQNKMRKLRKIS